MIALKIPVKMKVFVSMALIPIHVTVWKALMGIDVKIVSLCKAYQNSSFSEFLLIFKSKMYVAQLKKISAYWNH